MAQGYQSQQVALWSRARRDSAVLVNNIALWQAGDICQTIGEFLVQYLTKRVPGGIQSFAKEIHLIWNQFVRMIL